jgi:hypothetical protein
LQGLNWYHLRSVSCLRPFYTFVWESEWQWHCCIPVWTWLWKFTKITWSQSWRNGKIQSIHTFREGSLPQKTSTSDSQGTENKSYQINLCIVFSIHPWYFGLFLSDDHSLLNLKKNQYLPEVTKSRFAWYFWGKIEKTFCLNLINKNELFKKENWSFRLTYRSTWSRIIFKRGFIAIAMGMRDEFQHWSIKDSSFDCFLIDFYRLDLPHLFNHMVQNYMFWKDLSVVFLTVFNAIAFYILFLCLSLVHLFILIFCGLLWWRYVLFDQASLGLPLFILFRFSILLIQLLF